MNFVLCQCGKHYHANIALERIRRDNGIYSVGARCPHCGNFIHSYFESDELCKLRDSLAELGRRKFHSKRERRNYEMANDHFAREFSKLQSAAVSEVNDGG